MLELMARGVEQSEKGNCYTKTTGWSASSRPKSIVFNHNSMWRTEAVICTFYWVAELMVAPFISSLFYNLNQDLYLICWRCSDFGTAFHARLDLQMAQIFFPLRFEVAISWIKLKKIKTAQSLAVKISASPCVFRRFHSIHSCLWTSILNHRRKEGQ